MAAWFDAYGPYLMAGLVLAVMCGFVFLVVKSAIWAYHDAEDRGKPGWAVALLVVLCKWPISLLLWLVVRPPLTHQHNGELTHPQA